MADEKNTGRYSVIELSNYAAPEIKEQLTKNWVKYGDDNLYFDYLLERYRGSPTNHAIINGISLMIVGKGLDSPLKTHRPSAYAEAVSLFHEDDLKKWAFDLKWGGVLHNANRIRW